MDEKNLQIVQTVISSICETEIEDVETAQTVTSLFNQLIAEVRRLNAEVNNTVKIMEKVLPKFYWHTEENNMIHDFLKSQKE